MANHIFAVHTESTVTDYNQALPTCFDNVIDALDYAKFLVDHRGLKVEVNDLTLDAFMRRYHERGDLFKSRDLDFGLNVLCFAADMSIVWVKVQRLKVRGGC